MSLKGAILAGLFSVGVLGMFTFWLSDPISNSSGAVNLPVLPKKVHARKPSIGVPQPAVPI